MKIIKKAKWMKKASREEIENFVKGAIEEGKVYNAENPYPYAMGLLKSAIGLALDDIERAVDGVSGGFVGSTSKELGVGHIINKIAELHNKR